MVYDNGTYIIGTYNEVVNYLVDVLDEHDDDDVELIRDLEALDVAEFVMISDGNGMGYTIDYWSSKDKVMRKL